MMRCPWFVSSGTVCDEDGGEMTEFGREVGDLKCGFVMKGFPTDTGLYLSEKSPGVNIGLCTLLVLY